MELPFNSDNSNEKLATNPPETKYDQGTDTLDQRLRLNYTCR